MENKISNEEKAKELSDFLYFKLSHIDYNTLNKKIIEMAEWKDKEFQNFIDSMGLIVKENYQNYKNTRNHNTSTKNENISIMTREEEIKQTASFYQLSNSQEKFIEGANWADQHPKEGLVDVKKVEQWIVDCFTFLNESGNHNFKIDMFLENFKRMLEE